MQSEDVSPETAEQLRQLVDENPYEPPVAVNPFAEKEAELDQEAIYGTGIPRCGNPDCQQPLKLNGGRKLWCNKTCRKAAKRAEARARRERRKLGVQPQSTDPETQSEATSPAPGGDGQ